MSLIHGDCLEVMPTLAAGSVDAVVTDPPYDLGEPRSGSDWKSGQMFAPRSDETKARRRVGFMGKAWDGTGVAFDPATWAEVLRVTAPGGYLLAFGGTRTYHRMTVAIEDAGWIIRDCLVWAYASGFPKSRALLKPAWEPIVMARKPGPLRELAIDACRIGTEGGGGNGLGSHFGQDTIPGHVIRPTATMDAWENDANLCVSCAVDADNPASPGTPGTRASTTRKPAARQPNDSAMSGATSRAATGCSHGMTAALAATSSSTDGFGSRPTGLFLPGSLSTISTKTSSTTTSRTCTCCGGRITPTTTSGTRSDTAMGRQAPTTSASTESVGRWPSNVLLTDPIFDGDVPGVVGGGYTSSGFMAAGSSIGIGYGGGPGGEALADTYGDSGTYSRFFLVPKADRAEREPLLPSGLVQRHGPTLGISNVDDWTNGSGNPGKPPQPRRNAHPTVKPLDLMRHLVRLVTPTGGTVLDPFLGSGTTALAAEMEGFQWIGIEREAEYIAIAEARLNGTQRGLGLEVPA